jgi:hypothetical protein
MYMVNSKSPYGFAHGTSKQWRSQTYCSVAQGYKKYNLRATIWISQKSLSLRHTNKRTKAFQAHREATISTAHLTSSTFKSLSVMVSLLLVVIDFERGAGLSRRSTTPIVSYTLLLASRSNRAWSRDLCLAAAGAVISSVEPSLFSSFPGRALVSSEELSLPYTA